MAKAYSIYIIYRNHGKGLFNIYNIQYNICGNKINSNTFRCNTKRCKFQLDFYPSDKVVIIENSY